VTDVKAKRNKGWPSALPGKGRQTCQLQRNSNSERPTHTE